LPSGFWGNSEQLTLGFFEVALVESGDSQKKPRPGDLGGGRVELESCMSLGVSQSGQEPLSDIGRGISLLQSPLGPG
jgi:hypothetical protein